MSKNNHARSKQKRKKLRLKNLQVRTAVSRFEKLPADAVVPRWVRDEIKLKYHRQVFDLTQALKYGFKPNQNQRQKRKQWRQAPHSRKAA